MNSRLVILTTHFGTNFSGGSTATCEIFSRIEQEFEEIFVIGTQLGNHPFKALQFLRYKNWFHAVQLIKSLNQSGTIFYGDFYNSFLYAMARVPYYFTYHDNWPELGKLSLKNKVLGTYYWFFYLLIFSTAKLVITVSRFKEETIQKFVKNLVVIRNGVNKTNHCLGSKAINPTRLLMVGTVENRKYKKAINLFSRIEESDLELEIDIYGHIKERSVAKKLSAFNFINLRGFSSSIPYKEYKCLLHTSLMENLSMVWCEAIDNGLPVITFSVGGAVEVIDETRGILVDPYNIDQMINAIENLESHNQLIRESGKLSKEYSWKLASEKYLRLFSSEKSNNYGFNYQTTRDKKLV